MESRLVFLKSTNIKEVTTKIDKIETRMHMPSSKSTNNNNNNNDHLTAFDPGQPG